MYILTNLCLTAGVANCSGGTAPVQSNGDRSKHARLWPISVYCLTIKTAQCV